MCVCVWSRMEAVAVRDGEATVTSTHGRAKHCTQAARERGRCGRKGRRAATSCKRKWKGGWDRAGGRGQQDGRAAGQQGKKALEKRDHSPMHVCTSAHRTKSEITDTPLALLPRRTVFLLPLFIFINHFWVATTCRHRVMASHSTGIKSAWMSM